MEIITGQSKLDIEISSDSELQSLVTGTSMLDNEISDESQITLTIDARSELYGY